VTGERARGEIISLLASWGLHPSSILWAPEKSESHEESSSKTGARVTDTVGDKRVGPECLCLCDPARGGDFRAGRRWASGRLRVCAYSARSSLSSAIRASAVGGIRCVGPCLDRTRGVMPLVHAVCRVLGAVLGACGVCVVCVCVGGVGFRGGGRS
jgi:hypothetical protein